MGLIHENVITEGIPLKKLLTLEIVHEPNEHGKASLTGEAEIPVLKNFMERETDRAITVKSVMKANEIVLFLGYITNISMETKGDYGVVSVELEDSSYLLDIRRQNKTYQNLGKSYGDILRDAYNGAGQVVVNVTDQPISKFILQMDETDPEYDDSSTTWFPYSTAYSSSDGSGWYVMPEVGDFVRILCPSNHEEEAFAASAINTSPPASTRNKSFRAPGGKELLLTDDGISMICNHQNIFIDLSQDNGVSIISSQPVHISSDKCVNIEAAESVHITAGKQILLQSGTSHVKLTEKQITFGGESVIVGE